LPNKRWGDLSSMQKRAVVLSGVVQLGLLAAAVVAASLLSGCAAQSPRPSGEQASKPGREEASQGDAELGHPALGDPGAPVVMVEYGDFQ
jgi:hypothetical protein